MANLYELSAEYAHLIEDYECAETDEEAEAIFESIVNTDEDISQKAENYAKLIKNVEADIDSYKKESNRLAEKAKHASNFVDRLKQYVREAMKTSGKDEIKTTIGKWKLQLNPWSCTVTDPDSVPEAYHIKQPDKIDKTQLLRDFKTTGEIIDGCEFNREQGIRFK